MARVKKNECGEHVQCVSGSLNLSSGDLDISVFDKDGGGRKVKSLFHKRNTLIEIRRLQKYSGLLIRRRPLIRLLKSVMVRINSRFTLRRRGAIIFHEAVEGFIGSILEDSNLCAAHAKRQTVVSRDVNLACRIRRCVK